MIVELYLLLVIQALLVLAASGNVEFGDSRRPKVPVQQAATTSDTHDLNYVGLGANRRPRPQQATTVTHASEVNIGLRDNRRPNPQQAHTLVLNNDLDAEALAQLSKYMIHQHHRRSQCNQTAATHAWQPLRYLNSSYIDRIINTPLKHGGWGIVSIPRRRITAWLTKAALMLPEGDIVETGCFFGTSAAIMLHILGDFDACNNRKLWLFDSFEGLPPLTKEDHNQGIPGQFAASKEHVIENLQTTNYYNENRVILTKGWFNETCSISPVKKIAFLRLDGDLFASTWDAITALYDRVVPGGMIYVDDYGSFAGCRAAIDKFREENKIYETIHYVREKDKESKGWRFEFEAIWWVKRNNNEVNNDITKVT